MESTIGCDMLGRVPEAHLRALIDHLDRTLTAAPVFRGRIRDQFAAELSRRRDRPDDPPVFDAAIAVPELELEPALRVCMACCKAFSAMADRSDDVGSFLLAMIFARLVACLELAQQQHDSNSAVH